MFWWKSSAPSITVVLAMCLVVIPCAAAATAWESPPRDDTSLQDPREERDAEAAQEEDQGVQLSVDAGVVLGPMRRAADWLVQWYVRTEPADRVAWGGLVGCAAFGLAVVFERSIKLRRRRIVPADFTARFLDLLHAGKLDCGGALDHCELNPSPAARIALAAVRRWGRPASDLERAVALALRVETDYLRRNVASLRRIAALAPLVGLLGTLFAIGRVLESIPPGAAFESAGTAARAIAWGPALSSAMVFLSAGIIIATLALVAYDGLQSRIEKLAAALDRVGAETIDAIAMAAPVSAPPLPIGASSPVRPAPAVSGGENDAKGRSVPAPHHGRIRRDEGVNFSKSYDQQEAGF